MSKLIKPLSVRDVANAKPAERLYKLGDGYGYGLALWVSPNGRKVWRFEYTRKDKKKDTLTIGRYPEISLADARKKRTEYRAQLAHGQDPKYRSEGDGLSFETVTAMWLERKQTQVTLRYFERIQNNLKLNIPSRFNGMAINKIKAADVVAVLGVIEKRGAHEQVNRLKQIMRSIYEFANSRGLCEHNPVASIGANAFTKPTKAHYEALRPEELPFLIKTIDNSRSSILSKSCFYLQLLTLTRPTEAAHARWDEFDFDKRIWTIPEARMKMNRVHLVPLSEQVIRLLRNLQDLALSDEYVFPHRKGLKPFSNETVRITLRHLGVKSTAHGLRTLGSTILNESGQFRADVIEKSLAHVERSKSRAAYNRAEYLNERRRMLSWWADFVYQHRS